MASEKIKDQNELKFKENIKTDISGENTEHKTGARGEEEKPAKTARCQRYKTDSSSLTLRQIDKLLYVRGNVLG
jgi:hypothetical protein